MFSTNPKIHQSINPGAVVPCFNEERTIGPLVLRLRQHLDRELCKSLRSGTGFPACSIPLEISDRPDRQNARPTTFPEVSNRVVVVDDGSTDNTALNAKRAGATVLRHERNRGKGAALQTGLLHLHHNLGCEWAFTLDGDGQHDPVDLPALLQCAEQTGALLVIGNRMNNAGAMPWLRRFVNRWMSTQLSRYSRKNLPDTQSGFRLIHLHTWADLPLSAQRFEIESEMLMAFLAANHPVEFVPIRAIPAARKSRIRPVADTVRWFKWWWQVKSDVPLSAVREPVANFLCIGK